MDSVALQSATLSKAGYEPTAERLEITFKDGTMYEYLGVPQAVYDGLLAAASHGAYFNRTIRDGPYPCRRLA
jgi:hypothetical protein